MKYFKDELPSTSVRICRIQVSSPVLNKSGYLDHYYKIKVKTGGIYAPQNAQSLKEWTLEYYAAADTVFTNYNNFYKKVVEDNGNIYVDIACYFPTNVNQRVHVEVETVNDHSVTFFFDSADLTGYTRINPMSTANTVSLDQANMIGNSLFAWIGGSSDLYINVPKGLNTTITAKNTGLTSFISNENTIVNGDNESMTVTIDESGTLTQRVKIRSKANGFFSLKTE